MVRQEPQRPRLAVQSGRARSTCGRPAWASSTSTASSAATRTSGIPPLFEGTKPIETPAHDPNYHFDADLADHAIAWIRQQNSLAPDKPFFAYYAPGLTHAPHHAPKEWIAKFKGQFDQGWDKLREETLARQIKLGVVPPDTKLTPRPEEIPAWDSLERGRRRSSSPA